jgi:hypothetical protein
VNLRPGQIPGEGQVQLCQGCKEEPLSAMLCLHRCSAGVSTCSTTKQKSSINLKDYITGNCGQKQGKVSAHGVSCLNSRSQVTCHNTQLLQNDNNSNNLYIACFTPQVLDLTYPYLYCFSLYISIIY